MLKPKTTEWHWNWGRKLRRRTVDRRVVFAADQLKLWPSWAASQTDDDWSRGRVPWVSLSSDAPPSGRVARAPWDCLDDQRRRRLTIAIYTHQLQAVDVNTAFSSGEGRAGRPISLVYTSFMLREIKGLLTYLLTYLFIYFLTFLLACLLTYLFTGFSAQTRGPPCAISANGRMWEK